MLDSRSIVLISDTSAVGNQKPFGTGFVVHVDESATYVVTCMHVVEKITSDLRVDNQPATIVAFDEAKFGFDLAVLRIEGKLTAPCLAIGSSAKPGGYFVANGFAFRAGTYCLEEFGGMLGKRSSLKSMKYGYCGGWHLKLGDSSQLQDGYSGSPVVDRATGRVIGVVAIKMEESTGIAIAIEPLGAIWPEIPSNLSADLSRKRSNDLNSKSEPFMNLTIERQAFGRILNGEERRTILIGGNSGMGKSHLLKIYRRMAEQTDLDVLFFDLAAQAKAEACIGEIVGYFGTARFAEYGRYLDANSAPSDRDRIVHWQNGLNRRFFNDLIQHDYMDPVVLFFDQVEKTDQLLKLWLSNFVTFITPETPLIVVIAGRDLEPFPSNLPRFILGGLDMEDFVRYVNECEVDVRPEEITLIHEVLKGRPKEFIDYISFRKSKTQPAIVGAR